MDIGIYNQIIGFIKGIITGTEWEGHVYAVGGCVRDLVRNATIKDIDLVVNTANGGVEFAEWLEENNYLQGEPVISSRFGTASFRFKKYPTEWLDCVQTRCESYVDRSSRNPVVEYGTIEDDAERRDFTVNALYHNISTSQIWDSSGRGIEDINNGLITTVDEPDIIFSDDPLRMLRAIRFASRYNWDIDNKTMEGIKKNCHRLDIISVERINNELTQMLQSARPDMAVRLLMETGLMKEIIPEFVKLSGLEQNKYHFGDVYEHTLSVLRYSAGGDIVEMLAALLHDIGKIETVTVDEKGNRHFIGHEFASAKMAKDILTRLKYPNDVIKMVSELVKWHMYFKPLGDNPAKIKRHHVRRMQFEMGNSIMFERLKRLVNADNLSHAPEYILPKQLPIIEDVEKQLAVDNECGYGYRSPIVGQEMLKLLDVPPSKIVGHAVKRTTEWAIKCEHLPSREQCIQYVKQNVKNWKKKYLI